MSSSGGSSAAVVCTDARQWNATLANCSFIDYYCPFQTPLLGSATGNVNRRVNGLTNISCFTGYQLIGEAVQICQPFNATRGQWNASKPSCTAIPDWCPELNVSSTYIKLSTLNRTISTNVTLSVISVINVRKGRLTNNSLFITNLLVQLWISHFGKHIHQLYFERMELENDADL
jgi:hypothetical protein